MSFDPLTRRGRLSGHAAADFDNQTLSPVGTAVLWLSCLVTGVLGLIIPYPAPPPLSPPPPSPVQAQLMHVDLTRTIAPALTAQPTEANALPREITPAAPAPIPLAAVAAPSPAIAFAVPIEGPVRFAPANQAVATPTHRSTGPPQQSVSNTASHPIHLILGRGEGRQPAPEYPYEAIRQDQEGTVVVRFTVSETGSVLTAQALVPSPYPLLNQAALQAIRDTWHFASGPVRSYEVSIQFQLQPK